MNKRIVLFASGDGSNVEQICRFFEQDATVSVQAVLTNKAAAGVINRVKPFGIEAEVFDKSSFTDGTLLAQVKNSNPDLIVLAGFLWKMGVDWVKAFPKKIINIHP